MLYCHGDAALSCQGGEACGVLSGGHLHLHLGQACKLGACTDNGPNLQAMSLLQGRHNHYIFQSQLLSCYSQCEHLQLIVNSF